MFGLLRNNRLVYKSRREVGGGVTAFSFAVKKGTWVAQPGQHGVVAVSMTARKPFSIASAPEEEDVLIATSLRSGSAFKRRLQSLREGDHVFLRGPVFTYGQRLAIEDRGSWSVLLAQGVGITPFRSILSHHTLAGTDLKTSLIHVAGGGHAFREDTERWTTEARYLDRAGDFRAAVSSAAKDDREQVFYVAGAPAFVSSTVTLLREQGVPRQRIKEDRYLFYKPGSNLAELTRP